MSLSRRTAPVTTVGMTASLHVAASIPYFLIHEGYSPDNRLPGLAKRSWSLRDDGHVTLPEGPGIGVEVDEARLAELSKERQVQVASAVRAGWFRSRLLSAPSVREQGPEPPEVSQRRVFRAGRAKALFGRPPVSRTALVI